MLMDDEGRRVRAGSVVCGRGGYTLYDVRLVLQQKSDSLTLRLALFLLL